MEITNKNFEEEILRSKLPVLIEFWASWCAPCQMMTPLLDKLEKEYKNKIKIGKINIDKNPSLSSKFDIKGVPTFIFFKNGKKLKRNIGAMSEEQIKKMMELND